MIRPKPITSFALFFAWAGFAIVLILSGCATTIEVADDAEADTVEVAPVPPMNTATTDDPAESAIKAGGAPLVPIDLNKGNDSRTRLPIRTGEKPTAINLKDPGYNLASDLTKDLEDPDDMIPFTLSGDDDLATTIEQFSGLLDFQYFIEPGVSGAVNMKLDTEMTRKDAWQLFEHILWLAGAYASKNHGFIHILPFARMPEERRIFAKHDPIPNVEVALVRILNITADKMNALIKPFMTKGATATVVQHMNGLLIVEAPANMPKIHELIERLDVLGETQWPQVSIACRNVDAAIILDELKQILPTLGFPVSGSDATGRGGGVKLVALERLQVIIAAAPLVDVLSEVQRWVNVLDHEDTGEQERIYFYAVKNNEAEDLSDAISTFFTDTRTTSSAPASSSTAAPAAPNTATRPSSRAGSTARTNARPSTRQQAGTRPETIFDVPVTLFADGAHNRLVVRTTPRAWAMLLALLQRLDTPPLQVLIQVTIAEIQLNKNTEHGFQYAALNRINEYELTTSLTPGTVSDELYRFTFNSQGVTGSDTLANPGDVFSFIQAVAGKSNTRVLFAPQILATSDQLATINVGDDVPIVTQENNNTSSNSNISRSITYQDTGIILSVTPHITADKLVTLDLKQEVSDAIETTTSDIDSPTIQTRSLETSVIVEDGATVLLGGLISTRKVKSNRGLPGVKDIPWLGKFFSFTTDSERRQELLLLINVRVVDRTTDMQQLIQRYEQAIQAITDDFGDFNTQ